MVIAAKILVLASLLAAALFDLIRREIPDTCSLLIIAATSLLALAEPAYWREALTAFSAGIVILLAGATLFFAGVWGGGDAKLAGAVAAWVGWAGVPTLLLHMALVGGALAVSILALRPAARFLPWLAAERGVPYGIAIAAAGIIAKPALGLGG